MSINAPMTTHAFWEIWDSSLQKESSEEDVEINEKILEKLVALYAKYETKQKEGEEANRNWIFLQPNKWWFSCDSEEKRPLFLKYLKRLEKLIQGTLIKPSDLPYFDALAQKECFYFDASLIHRRGYYTVDQTLLRNRVAIKTERLTKKLSSQEQVTETELREKLFQKLKKCNKYKQTVCDLNNHSTSIYKMTHFLVSGEKEYLIIECEQGLYFTKDSDFLKAYSKILGMLSGNEITVKEWYFSEESPIKSPSFWDSDWRDDEEHTHSKYSKIDSLLIDVLEKIMYEKLEIPTPKIAQEKMTILELFAGKGDLALKFAKKNEKNLRPYILVDGSLASLEEAQTKLSPFADHIQVIDRSVDLVHADYRTLIHENPAVIVISGGVTEQVLKDRAQGLRCIKKSYALLPDFGFLVLTGLAPCFYSPEELEQILRCKILNRVYLKDQHWFYVLQKVSGETIPQSVSPVLDLFSYFHFNKRDDRIDLLLKSLGKVNEVQALDLAETDITPTEFQTLIRNFPNLKSVRLCGTHIISHVVGDLLKLENCLLDVSGTEITEEIASTLIQEGKFRDLIVDGCPNIQLLQQLKIRGIFALKNNPLEPDFSFLTSHFSYLEPRLIQSYFEDLIDENSLEKVQTVFLEAIPLNDETLVHLIANLGIEKLEISNCDEELSLTWLNVYYLLKECSSMKGSNWTLGLVAQNLENLSHKEIGKALSSVLTFMTDPELIDNFCDKITAISFQSGTFPWENLGLLARFERLQILDLSNCRLGIEKLSLDILNPLFALPLKQLYIRFTPLETEIETFIELLLKTDCPLRDSLETLYVNLLVSPPELNLPFQVVPISESEKRLEIGEPEEKLMRLRSRQGFDKRFLDS